jgi:hypothetical protein
MISDAFVTVTCDGCFDTEQVALTATARRSWDERDVTARLKSMGWVVEGDEHFCGDCACNLGMK